MKPKLGSVILLVALLLSIALAVNFALGRNQEHARRVWAEDQLEKIRIAKEALEQERDQLVKTKEMMEQQLSDASAQAKDLAEQIAREKRARESLTEEIAQVRKEAMDRTQQIEKDKQSLADELAKAKQSYQALSNELTTLRQAKEALERRVKEMLAAQGKQADKIVVKPNVGATPPPTAMGVPAPAPMMRIAAGGTLEGKVLVVNREFNFIVVNLGSKDGIKSGTEFAVMRSNKQIGKAQVERIYDNMAAASLLAEEKKGDIREGDLVRQTS